jgi:hypothetical protein
MAGNDLTATLGVDGKPFQDGVGRILENTTRGMAGVGQRMGRRMTSAFLGVFGYLSITRMVGETIRWAKSTEAVRKEYEQMGIVLSDNVVNQMVSAGREFARMGVQFKITMIPVMAALADASQAIVQAIQRAWAYWSAVAKGGKEKTESMWQRLGENLTVAGAILTGPRGKGSGATGKETNLEVLRRAWNSPRKVQPGEEPSFSEILKMGDDAVEDFNKKLIDRMTQVYLDIQNISPTNDFKLGSSGRGGGSRLASIGGDVGGLNDRVVRIEQEQVRILKQIATNTKPKGAGGQLEIPTS